MTIANKVFILHTTDLRVDVGILLDNQIIKLEHTKIAKT
jgi:hypothetical protein